MHRSFICFFVEYLGLEIDVPYVSILFFGTLVIYSMHRLVGVERVDKPFVTLRYKAYAQYKYIIIFIIIISLSLSCYAFLHLSEAYYVGLGIALLLSIGYSLPLFPNDKRLRDYSYIKVLLIALVWTGLTVFIPLSANGVELSINLRLSVERCLYILAITIPFDIRDYKIDQLQKVETLPSWLGKEKARQVALIFIGLAAIICLVNFEFFDLNTGYLVALLTTYMISAILIYNSSEDKHDYYYTGLLDGTMMIPYFMLLIIDHMV